MSPTDPSAVVDALAPAADPWRPTRVVGLGAVPALLQSWNEAELLEAADLHLAVRLGALAGESDSHVLLACALTVRAAREGSVCLDLAAVQHAEEDVPPVPDLTEWTAAVRASPLVGPDRPWVWDEDRLYLHRHLADERHVAADLTAREHPAQVDEAALEAALDEAYPAVGDATTYADQRDAVATACRHRTSLITGGPGTGKTTTLARLIGVLLRLQAAQPADSPPLRIHLAAPTGKAAARMAQSVRAAADDPDSPFPDLRDRLRELPSTTVHRLLGFRPGHRARFAHDRTHHLPVDVVVIDEASMLSLTLTARVLEALRPAARLVLLGDADQLASVDAGAVLDDLVEGLERRPDPPVARLHHSRRFGSEIGSLAAAVRDGDTARALRLLREGDASEGPIRWVAEDGAPRAEGGRVLQEHLAEQALALHDAGLRGDPADALATLGASRVLCAHREGPYGAATWNRQAVRLLGAQLSRHLPLWYAGRPLLVERNDQGLGLSNGDVGIVVAEAGSGVGSGGGAGGSLAGVVDDGTAAGRRLAVSRLSETTTAYAMTVHRAQGSQFAHVVMLLPDPSSRILSRQLLYTAITRAAGRVTLVGTEQSVVAAIEHRASRATLLARRVGGDPLSEEASPT